MSDFHHKVTISAAAALSTVLGSIHAFSVFIPQWESLPGADRANVSLIYSLALVSLTIAVLFGYRVYRRVPPFAVLLIVGVLAALGLALSAGGSSVASLYLTYGLIFGSANGLGYGYALQLSGQAASTHRGLVMGLITAFYAVGATTAPVLFVYLIDRGGNALALKAMSVIVLVVSVVAAILVRWSRSRYHGELSSATYILSPALKNTRMYLWVGYGSAVTAGLMVIGHAYGIATWLNLTTRSATWATTVVALGNMLGGFSAGYYVDRLSSRVLQCWLPVITSFGLMILILPMDSIRPVVFIGLGLVGYSYGAIIAVYPVAVVDVFGALLAAKIYGQVFTAWGLAGLLGPWLSGWLYDFTGTYTAAILIAALLSGVSVIAIRKCSLSCCKQQS